MKIKVLDFIIVSTCAMSSWHFVKYVQEKWSIKIFLIVFICLVVMSYIVYFANLVITNQKKKNN